MATVERKVPDSDPQAVRLNRFLALAGVGSRRKNDELIAAGSVKVNGEVVRELGVKVHPGRDRVTVDGRPIELAQRFVYVLLNKPRDCITTVKDERGRATVFDYVRLRERVYPVGRLDRNTTGVLLLCNDGELAHALTHPAFQVEKEYRVRVDRGVKEDDRARLRKGVRLSDGLARIKRLAEIPGTHYTEFLIVVGEGRNRLVRRIFEELGYEVKRLERTAFAGLTAAGLGRGKWRFLSDWETERLRALAGLSKQASIMGELD